MKQTDLIASKDVATKYGLPADVVFCRRCVISNQRPRIRFDEEGVCSACRYADRKHRLIDWQKREEELLRVLDRHRRSDGGFDVIVPCSGGKDSAFVAHQLKSVYGMSPLTVTWSPLKYTDIGWQNLQRMIARGFSKSFTADRMCDIKLPGQEWDYRLQGRSCRHMVAIFLFAAVTRAASNS